MLAGCFGGLSGENRVMASFDIVSRIDLQEVDNAVNITKKATVALRFSQSKTEITLDKKKKKIRVTTEDDEDESCTGYAHRKPGQTESRPKVSGRQGEPYGVWGMIQREITIKEGVDSDTARNIVKMIKEQKLKVQAAIQENQVRVTGKKIDDLQAVIQILRGANIPIPLQFINLQS